MAVFAPMPRPRIRTTTAAKPGALARERTAWRNSRNMARSFCSPRSATYVQPRERCSALVSVLPRRVLGRGPAASGPSSFGGTRPTRVGRSPDRPRVALSLWAMPATTTRIHNFSAGPAVLPVRVLEQVQSELLDYRGTGMSVLEMSHRSAAFEGIVAGVEADLRCSPRAHGRARGAAAPGWSEPAVRHGAHEPAAGRRLGRLRGHRPLVEGRAQGSGEARDGAGGRLQRGRPKFDRIPAPAEIQADPQAAYLHFTSNNTIYGTEWFGEPETAPGVPLVCDASSDFLSRPLPMAKYGLVYAGAQKNLGPAGVTVVVVRRDLLSRVPAGLPALLDYRLLDENKSLYNTPPCFAIYVVGLVLKWLRDAGGLAGIETVVIDKARPALRRHRRQRRLLPRPRPAGGALAHERDLPPAQRGPREGLRQAGHRGRPRRAQGPPLGGRPAGLALQRPARGDRSMPWWPSCRSSSVGTAERSGARSPVGP